MKGVIINIRKGKAGIDDLFSPLFFRMKDAANRKALNDLLQQNHSLQVFDEIDGQLRELIKSLNPSVKIKAEDYPALIEKHLDGCTLDEYGVWVFYPWSNKLVHILDEE